MKSHLLGEKSGERTGIAFFIVVKDVDEINLSNKEIYDENIRGFRC